MQTELSGRNAPRCARALALALLAFALTSQAAIAQSVIQAEGVDSRVDYESLKRFGPWDDRNYRMTAEDLALLSEADVDVNIAVPAFFKAEIQRSMQERGLELVRYPRSTVPRFRSKYGGYLVGRKLYRGYRRTADGYEVLTQSGVEPLEFLLQRSGVSESRVTDPNGAAESAVAIKPTDTDIVVAGTNGPGPGQEMHYSTDGGATWTSSGVLPGSCCDPTLGWSTDGATAYTATLGNTTVDIYTSTDNGQSWGNKVSLDNGFVDKEYLHVDGHASSPHRDNVYLTWHLNNEMRFARYPVTDARGVAMWSDVTRFESAPEGIGSDITSDKNGHVYYLYPDFNNNIIMLKSTDGAVSFAAHQAIAAIEGVFDFPLPSMETRRVFIYVSADTDLSNGTYGNSVYASWTDSTAATGNNANNNHGRITVGYSRDGGSTWNFSTPHSTADQNSVDRYHQWLKVGPDGTVHIVYYDTGFDPDGAGPQTSSRNTVDFYYAYSTDGAQSWSTPERLTTVSSENIGDNFEWGDYNGLDVVLNDLIGIYTDNRNEGARGADSVDVYTVRRSVGSNTDVIFADDFESGNTDAWSGGS